MPRSLEPCLLLVTLGVASASFAAHHETVDPSPNGIAFPADYPDWDVISISHRTDNNTMRGILGNDTAIRAARVGQTNPWPDGAVLGTVVWKQMAEEFWPAAVAPQEFVHAEFMFKDQVKWADTGGWGYARWKGKGLEAYGRDASFAQERVACHTPVKARDWVFTTPAETPAKPTM